jgi:hypothetical protein
MKFRQLAGWQLGTGLFAIAILMNRFLPSNNAFDFIEGLLTGLSIALNLQYAFKRSGKTLSA